MFFAFVVEPLVKPKIVDLPNSRRSHYCSKARVVEVVEPTIPLCSLTLTRVSPRFKHLPSTCVLVDLSHLRE